MPYGKKTAYKKGCFKMKGPSLYKFNAGLRKASAEGKLDDNPKFKAAVDAAPMKKKGCKSAYKMLNIRNKSNKPCTGCKTICPSCRGKK